MTAAVAVRLARGAREDGVVRGYASVFGAVDLSGDEVAPGAFAASLRARGAAGVKMLWQHDPGRPIGVWTRLDEDRTGLWAEGRLALDTRGGREAWGLVRAGALDGLSIGFRTRRAERGGRGAKRRLVEIDLWEISIVTFPMQELARLAAKRVLRACLGTPPGRSDGAFPAPVCRQASPMPPASTAFASARRPENPSPALRRGVPKQAPKAPLAAAGDLVARMVAGAEWLGGRPKPASA